MTVHLLQVYLPKTIPAHSRAGGRSDARGFNDRPKAVSHFEKRKSTNKRQFKRALTSEVAQDGSNGPDATPYDLGDNPLRSQFDYTIENGQRTHLEETFYFDDDGLSTTPDVAKTTTYDWAYDANDRLISETIDHHDDTLDRTEHFVMDLFGNRLSRTVDYVDPLATDQAFAYTYDDNDRLISETLDTGNDGTVDQTTTYDWGQDDTVTPALLGGTQQLGKTVQDSSSNTVSTQTFSYNLQGRLASVVSTPSSGSATKVDYQYDSSGIRISTKQFTDSNANGQFETGELDETVEYLVDHRNHTGYAQTIVETTKDSSDVITKRIAYTFGTDEITQTVTDYIAGVAQTPTVHTFGHDAHGSVRVLLDAAGAIAQAYTYAAYGELLAIHNATGASVTDANTPGLADDAITFLLYSGESFDSRIGQQYLRARWYDTAVGRFSRLDPYFGTLRSPLAFNKYNYANSNPILNTDPSGLVSLSGLSARLSVASFLTTIISAPIIGGLASANALQDGTPDAFVASISGGLAGLGFGLAITGHFILDFKTREVYLIPEIEGGTAPLSRFAKERGKSAIGAVGLAFNMNHIGDLAGVGFTTTFPIAGFRYLNLLARPFTRGQAVKQATANYLLALRRLNGKNIVNHRTRASIVATQSTSGAAVIQIGQASGSFAFGSTVGYGLAPISRQNATGAVRAFLDRAKEITHRITENVSAENLEGILKHLSDEFKISD